ncbi:MAG: hypothetical protein ISS57_12160, partial [Anaerolineales bacterium]|nr:hypothetical protein [Anaerolineales bacterium]
MKRQYLIWLIFAFVLSDCTAPTDIPATPSSSLPLSSVEASTPTPQSTKIPTATEAPTLTATSGKYLTFNIGGGDCSLFPDWAQLGDGNALFSARTSIYGCFDFDPLPHGITPRIYLELSQPDGSSASLVWSHSHEVFRKQGSRDVNNALVLYDSEEGVVEFRIGLASAGLSQSEPVQASMKLAPYYDFVSMDPAGEPVIELQGVGVFYQHQKDPDDLATGNPSRSPLADHYNVPKGWDARVVGPTLRYQNIWGIYKGDGTGYFLFQNDTPTKTGVQDAIRYVSFQGEDICAATMSDMGRSFPIYGVIEGPEGSVLAVTYQGLLLQVHPYSQTDAIDSVIQEGLPVCHYEKYTVIGGALEPLVYVDGDVIAHDPDTKSIFRLPKGEGRSGADPISPEFMIASGFGRVQNDSAVLLEDGQTMLVWDFLTGMHEIDLDTKQDRVIYRPSSLSEKSEMQNGQKVIKSHDTLSIYNETKTGDYHGNDPKIQERR